MVIRSQSAGPAKALAATLARRWKSDSAIERVCSAESRADTLKGKALQDLSPEDLINLRRRLEANRDLLVDFAASPTIWSLSAASKVQPDNNRARWSASQAVDQRVLQLWQSVDEPGRNEAEDLKLHGSRWRGMRRQGERPLGHCSKSRVGTSSVVSDRVSGWRAAMDTVWRQCSQVCNVRCRRCRSVCSARSRQSLG